MIVVFKIWVMGHVSYGNQSEIAPQAYEVKSCKSDFTHAEL